MTRFKILVIEQDSVEVEADNAAEACQQAITEYRSESFRDNHDFQAIVLDSNYTPIQSILPKRSKCECVCHDPDGEAMHAFPCCEPD